MLTPRRGRSYGHTGSRTGRRSTLTDPMRARWALPRRYRSRICAFSYSANIPWNSHQQLVLGAVSTRALDELHPGAGTDELLDQQGLVGELAGEAVRRVAQHHIDADPGNHIPELFQGRAYQGGSRVPFVFEHPLLRQLHPQLPGVGAQRRGLRRDCV